MKYETIVRQFLKLIAKLNKLVELRQKQSEEIAGRIKEEEVKKEELDSEKERAIRTIKKLEEIFA